MTKSKREILLESKVQQQEKTIQQLTKTLQKIVVMAERTCANDDDINMHTLDGIDRIRLAARDAITKEGDLK